MSHHEGAGSNGERHDHGAERHSHHHHQHHHHQDHGHGRERGHPGPHLEAHASGSPQEIAGYLDDLANAIRAGGITIRTGERAVGLRLNGEVAFDLRAAAGNGATSQVNLSLSWHAPQPPKPPTPPAPKLTISPLRTPDQGAGGMQGGPGGPGEGGPGEMGPGQEPYPGNPPSESIPEGQTFGA